LICPFPFFAEESGQEVTSGFVISRFCSPFSPNFRFTRIVATLLSVTVIGVNIYFVEDYVRNNLPPHWAVYTALGVFGVCYMIFCGYLAFNMLLAFGLPCCGRLPVS
jgi:hypothetical protein